MSEHGTRARYLGNKNEPGCRCIDCTHANSEYSRVYLTELRRLARIGKAVEKITKGTK